MKAIFYCLVCWLTVTIGVAQEKVHAKKLTKEEEAQLTTEQRLAHETERRSRNGKKKISTKEKARIQKRQVKRASKVRPPSQPKRSKND